MRIALAVCLVAGCTLIGRSMSAAVRRRVAVLEQMIRGLKMLRIRMAGMLDTVDQAFETSDCDAFRRISHEMKRGLSAGEAWNSIRDSLCGRGGVLDALSESDVAIIEGLFENLGQEGRQAQEIRFNDSIRRLSEQREGARLQQTERERLYVTVGFLMGIMLALVVI